IINEKDKWLAVVPNELAKNKFCHRSPKFPLLEKAMSLWIESTIIAKIPISEMLIKEKAKFFMEAFNIEESDLKLSNGWIEKFKCHNNLHVYRLYGEAKSAPLDTLFEERQKSNNLLSQYTLDQIYNADETALYYQEHTDQDYANSDSEKKLGSNIIVGSSSKASSKVSSKIPSKKCISNKKQKMREKHVQNEASLLDNNELDELLNKLPLEDNHATALSSAMVDYFNDIDQTIATEEALTDQQIVTLIQNEE
ncbi:25660_t:CDS:2, partial [Racocetra persica]